MQINLIEPQRVLEKATDLVIQERSQLIRQELRRRIDETLECARNILLDNSLENCVDNCVIEVRARLSTIQDYCKTVEKKFIFVEKIIACNQYDIGGHHQDTATLFRGPNEDASVAICITQKGSLLYRNDCAWNIYCNAGDIGSGIPVCLK